MASLFRTPVRNNNNVDRRERPLELLDDNRQQQQQMEANKPKAPNPPAGMENDPNEKRRKKTKPSSLCMTPPSLIFDKSGKQYNRGLCIGEGGFARCFQIDDGDGEIYAAKTLAKAALTSEKNRYKLITEIKYHRAMKHPNIVNFIDCFEDNTNVYILLEMCANQSLSDMVSRRRRLTEVETRYYFVQLLGAISYMHSRGIIHRDLKLGNIFLDKNMDLKVGDFGLAARIDPVHRPRRYTVCGTPNYISPEVLLRPHSHDGHTDMWAIGIILYTMLVGRPPFQKPEVDDIYKSIKKHVRSFPPPPSQSLAENHRNVSPEAKDLITQLLHPNPWERPTIEQCLNHPWLQNGTFIESIPATAFSMVSYYSPLMGDSKRNLENAIERAGLGPNGAALVPDRIVDSVNQAEMMNTNSKHILPPSISPPSTKDKYKPVLVDSPNGGNQGNKVAIYDSPIVGEGKFRKQKAVSDSPMAVRSSNHHNVNANMNMHIDTNTNTNTNGNTNNNGNLATRAFTSRSTRVAPVAARTSTNAPKPFETQRTTGLPASLSRPTNTSGPFLHRPSSAKSVNVQAFLKRSLKLTLERIRYNLSNYESLVRSGLMVMSDDKMPKSVPSPIFVTRWADFDDNWGMSYCLSDGSVGVLFRDRTSMRMDPVFNTFAYYESSSVPGLLTEHKTTAHTVDSRKKKMDILQYVRRYMDRVLGHAIEPVRTNHDISSGPIVQYITKRDGYIMFVLTNGTIQFNFSDHCKISVFDGGESVCAITCSRFYFCWKLEDVLSINYKNKGYFGNVDFVEKLRIVEQECRAFVNVK